MTELEEASTARLVMKKRDPRRRVRDEADIGLGGIDPGGRRGCGLAHEFDDVLRSVSRERDGVTCDGNGVRRRGERMDVLNAMRCLQMKLMHLDNGSVRGSRKPLRFRKRGPIGSNCHS